MMREILFRGICTETGEWVKGYYVCLNGKEHRIYSGYAETDCGDYYPDWEQVAPETVGQFTGLTDKNGKKIFEGDIIDWDELEWGCPHRELVEWNYSLFSMRKDDWEEWCEVIGNIHDNPELLEASDGN